VPDRAGVRPQAAVSPALETPYDRGALADAVGSQIMPKGGADTGFGGTAPRLPGSPAPWLAIIAVGVLVTMAGLASLRRSRRTAGAAGR
jgi:hypothetical protein